MSQATSMEKSDSKLNEVSIDVREFFNVLLHYKWSILLTTILMLLIAAFFLYFKASVYSSRALIEVKSNTKQSMPSGDLIGSAFSSLGGENVDKDIEILKTFHINNLALSKVNFQTQYFVKEGYKKVEIYENVPIDVKNLTVTDKKFLWKMIKLSPSKDGYSLQIENSFKTKVLHSLFNKEIIELDDEKIHHYGSSIKTDYFELTIEKKTKIEQPLYFILKGNNRQIYETIRKNLHITQINQNAPLIQVTYEDTIPKRADSYVNAVTESFIFQSVAEKSKQSNRIINFIEKQLNDIKTKLDNSERKLEKYRIEHQAIDPTLQARTYIEELSRIEIELSGNELKEVLMQNLLSFIEKGKNLDAMAPLLMELEDPSTLALITRLQEAQITEQGLKAEYSRKHPGLIAVRKQIQYIIKKIILNVQNLKSSMLHRNKNLAKLKKSYDKHLESLPTQERTLINLRRDYEVSSDTYNYLLKKKSEY
ncbi:MAG: Wzz/FepE/Etk N-terminal domain-containing protein, partial [Campylobacterota bacterium]|nr:Wzz/FepE/Etk N-terminal domain-containing protein [Campylobacterota bacterium]